jgi:16S rRNA (uracil1498-N3)-methyltransferase
LIYIEAYLYMENTEVCKRVMPKFFSEKIFEDKIIIDSEDVRHIKNVLRLKENEYITVCDGKGYDYEAVISKIKDREIECRIVSEKPAETEPNIKVTLYQGLPKASKMDYIIQKNTELGVSEIAPCALARCVVKLENKKAEQKKTERWQKISAEAAKQSGRGIIPRVAYPMQLDEVIEEMKKKDLSFVLYECENDKSLKRILTEKRDINSVGFLIGPEGGFDPAEIERLHDAGIPSVGLGRRILRTETAGEAVLSMVMYEIGDIND